MTAQTTLTFEAAYARLEEILEKMNSGKVALEESLKLYEEADKLIVWCSKRLTEAEKKIEVLTKNRDAELVLDPTGKPQTQPFTPSTHSPLTSGQF
ncbi:MAG: exodeoxyribonuclease VII small subunit [Verrucomicrobia bacterium]|nr:exodeoxyribonuclease VII small subunit [Verrucomicrobiota bacterium]